MPRDYHQAMQPPSLTSLRRVAAVLAVMLAALVLTTLAVAALEGALRIPDASATYLLAVVSVAVVFGTPAAVATAFGSFLLYDFLFVSPTGALIVADPEELLNLLLLLALGIVVGQLAGTQRARAPGASSPDPVPGGPGAGHGDDDPVRAAGPRPDHRRGSGGAARLDRTRAGRGPGARRGRQRSRRAPARIHVV